MAPRPKRISGDEFPADQHQHQQIRDELVDDEFVAASIAAMMSGEPVVKPRMVEPEYEPTPQHCNDLSPDEDGFIRIHDLPSRFQFYSEDAKIWARPFAVPEIKKLTNINGGNASDIMNDVLRRCMRGINVDELFINDRLYLVMWLRANSFPHPEFKVDYMCPICEKPSSFHLHPDGIHVNYIRDEFTGTFVLPISKVQVKYEYMRVRDEEKIVSFMSKNGRDFKEIDEELMELASQIKMVGGVKMNLLTAYNFIMGLKAEDYAALTSDMGYWEFGMSPYVSAECDLCGGTGHTPVRFHPSFFNPKYKPE